MQSNCIKKGLIRTLSAVQSLESLGAQVCSVALGNFHPVIGLVSAPKDIPELEPITIKTQGQISAPIQAIFYKGCLLTWAAQPTISQEVSYEQ